MKTIIIKVISSAVISYFVGPQLGKMALTSFRYNMDVSLDFSGGFAVVMYILAFLWSYFFISGSALGLHLGMLSAVIAGMLSAAIGGAIAIADSVFFVHAFSGNLLAEEKKEYIILMLVTVVLYLVFPIIDTILMIKTIRDRD